MNVCTRTLYWIKMNARNKSQTNDEMVYEMNHI